VITALISEDHAKSMIWSSSVCDDQLSDSDEDDTDRLFTFEVAKTMEQEEGVSVRQGFEACHSFIPYRVSIIIRLLSALPMNSSSPNCTQSVILTPSSSNHGCYLAKLDKGI